MMRSFGYARSLPSGAHVPSATVEVFAAGTQNLATIFSDNLSPATPKANPFLADANGYWFFYAAVGRYDVRFSGGTGTPVITVPYTEADQSLCCT